MAEKKEEELILIKDNHNDDIELQADEHKPLWGGLNSATLYTDYLKDKPSDIMSINFSNDVSINIADNELPDIQCSPFFSDFNLEKNENIDHLPLIFSAKKSEKSEILEFNHLLLELENCKKIIHSKNEDIKKQRKDYLELEYKYSELEYKYSEKKKELQAEKSLLDNICKIIHSDPETNVNHVKA